MTRKPRSPVRILIHRTRATGLRGSECGLGRCSVELHYGIVSGCYCFFYWLLGGCVGNWVEIHPPKQSHNAFRHNTDPISTSKTANRATDLAIESLWCFLNQYIRTLEYSIAFLDTTKSQWRRKERKRNKKRLANWNSKARWRKTKRVSFLLYFKFELDFLCVVWLEIS